MHLFYLYPVGPLTNSPVARSKRSANWTQPRALNRIYGRLFLRGQSIEFTAAIHLIFDLSTPTIFPNLRLAQ